MWEDSSLRLALGKQLETLPGKITKAKRAGGVAQVVEHMEALNSNPNTVKIKIKKVDIKEY
jgi:hypothetical protein